MVKRYATRGMKVMAGEPLLDIADLSEVWVVSEVSEADMAMMKQGMEARITVTGLPGKVFTSPIDFVYPAISPADQDLKVRCTLPNPW